MTLYWRNSLHSMSLIQSTGSTWSFALCGYQICLIPFFFWTVDTQLFSFLMQMNAFLHYPPLLPAFVVVLIRHNSLWALLFSSTDDSATLSSATQVWLKDDASPVVSGFVIEGRNITLGCHVIMTTPAGRMINTCTVGHGKNTRHSLAKLLSLRHLFQARWQSANQDLAGDLIRATLD